MSEIAPQGLFDRAIRRIQDVWRDMASGVAREDDDSIAAQMRACLAGRGGEVSARNRAAKLAQAYLGLDDTGRRAFLATLAGFDSDPATKPCARRPTPPSAQPRKPRYAARSTRRGPAC